MKPDQWFQPFYPPYESGIIYTTGKKPGRNFVEIGETRYSIYVLKIWSCRAS